MAHGLKVEVGLHQGWALSPFLFGVVMDRITHDIRQESLWMIVFADDSVICGANMEQVEERLEMWRHELERSAEYIQDHPSKATKVHRSGEEESAGRVD